MDRQTPEREEPDNKPSRYGQVWLYIILFLTLILPALFMFSTVKQITWEEFEQKLLARHAVERLEVVNNETVEVYIRPALAEDPAFKAVMKKSFGTGINPGPHFQFSIGSVESFERKLEDAQKNFSPGERISPSYIKSTNWFTIALQWMLPILFLIFMFRLLLGSGATRGSSMFNFGRSTATLLERGSKSSITFDDVAGLEEAKQEVKEIVDFLKDPIRYTKLGAKIPKGVIIVGPTGTGKTLLAKAVAGEAQVPFFSLSGSEFVEMFVGVGASRVRDLFKRAKEKAPAIIFIDEIDAVGQSRGKNTFYSGANDERESTLNQLLTEMDGFGTNSGVIVLAATNRGDMLDPALLRPGRFDRHIYLDLPNHTERKAIFLVHLKPLVLDNSVDPELLSAQTPGFSGADIANICNEAALIAARKRKEKVERQDFLDALDRIVAGLEKKSKILSAEEKRTIAYHEAGHAIVSWFLAHADPLIKVSIIPRGRSLGAAWYLPEEHQLRTRTELNERLSAALGGRAAEEVVLGEVSSGALDDLERVTKEAYGMVVFYGFSKKLGNVSFYDSGHHDVFQKPYSEETARLIDEEVRKLIDMAYQRAKELLLQHREALTAIADLLLQNEVIYKDDLEKVLGERVVKKPDGNRTPSVVMNI